MFEHLKEKLVILVTGPQRSGTRLIAKAIAYDTGHTYVDEVEIKTDSVYELFWKVQHAEGPLVVQCPGLCHLAPALVVMHSAFFMVICIRNIDDILASQERIGWEWEFIERLKYSSPLFSNLLSPRQHESISRIKYKSWEYDRQFLSPKQYCEVYYKDMKNHPLWVPKEQRKNWGFSQTELER